MEFTKQQYEYALKRIEALLPLVTDETPASDNNAVELTLVSDVVEAYEKIHYPIAKPSYRRTYQSFNRRKRDHTKTTCHGAWGKSLASK